MVGRGEKSTMWVKIAEFGLAQQREGWKRCDFSLEIYQKGKCQMEKGYLS